MVEFVVYYFPEKVIHIWTNGLITEENKELIRKYATHQSIKVILVDYSNNFLNK